MEREEKICAIGIMAWAISWILGILAFVALPLIGVDLYTFFSVIGDVGMVVGITFFIKYDLNAWNVAKLAVEMVDKIF